MIVDKNRIMRENINNVQLHVIDSGYAVANEEWSGHHIAPMYSRLYYITGGEPYIIKDGNKVVLEVGKCYLFPTGYTFSYGCNGCMEQLYFHISLSDTNGMDTLRRHTSYMVYTPEDGMIQRMTDCHKSHQAIDHLRLRRDVYDSLIKMLEKYHAVPETTNYSPCVKLALEYIRSHLTQTLTVSEVAAGAFVSESTLAKKFRSEVGLTIGNYIGDAVLFEAEQLLTKSQLTIPQISEQLGFCDQFYFSRRFKMKYGVRPQKYRKNSISLNKQK